MKTTTFLFMIMILNSCANIDNILYPGGKEAAKGSTSTKSNITESKNIEEGTSESDGSVEINSVGGKAHITIDNEYIGVTPVKHKFQCSAFSAHSYFNLSATPVDKGCDFSSVILCGKLPKTKMLVDIRCRQSPDININLKKTIKKDKP